MRKKTIIISFAIGIVAGSFYTASPLAQGQITRSGGSSSVTVNDPTTPTQKASVSASGHLAVDCSNCSGSGASAVDEGAFTVGSGSGAPAMGIFETSPSTLTTGHVGLFEMTTDRALFTNLYKVGGSVITLGQTTMSASLPVTLASNQSALSTAITQGGNTAVVKAASTAAAATDPALVVALSPNNAVAAVQSGNWTARVVGNAGGVVDFTGQNASSPANSFLIGGQFNTTPTTITSGNSSPLQLDSAGNLLVNIKAGAGSGGTAIADNAAFTQSTTNETPMSGLYTTSYTAATSGHSTVARMSSGGELFVNPTSGGTALFPAASALADGTANPTVTGVAAFLMGYNGTTWDRIHPSTDATVASTAPTTGPMLTGYANSSAPTAVTAGQAQYGWFDLSGRLHVTGDASMTAVKTDPSGVTSPVSLASLPALAAGTNNIGKIDVLGNAGAAFDAATGAAPPANALAIGGLASGATGGLMKLPPVCDSDAVINISTATTTRIITGVSGRKVHICGFYLGPNGSAQTVAIIEGTQVTTACDTGAAGMYGGTTAATGLSAAANGGITIVGGGVGDAMTTATTGDDVCLVTGSAVQTSGHVKYAIY